MGSTKREFEISFNEIMMNGIESFESKIRNKQIRFYSPNSYLKKIKLPSKLKEIRNCVFYGCLLLKEIEIPNNVSKIGEGTFYGCFSLTKIKLSKSIKIISKNLFSFCISLKEIEIPNGIKEIKECSFLDCESLKEIIIPESVTLIESEAFCECKSLTKLIIKNPKCYMKGEDIIEYCDNLKILEIPKEEEYLKEWIMSKNEKQIIQRIKKQKEFKFDLYYLQIVFKYFKSKNDFINIIQVNSKYKDIFDIFMTNSIEITKETNNSFQHSNTKYEIIKCSYSYFYTMNKNEKYTFKDIIYTKEDMKLFGNKIPEKVNVIGEDCFREINTLITIDLSNIKRIEEFGFSNCLSLETIKLSTQLTSIEKCCFFECSNLKSISFPSNITSIPQYCCFGCEKLTKIELGKYVERIEESSFDNCTSLKTIDLPSTLTEIQSSAFFNCKSLSELKIPKKCYLNGFGIFSYCSSLLNLELPFDEYLKEWNKSENEKKILLFLSKMKNNEIKFSKIGNYYWN